MGTVGVKTENQKMKTTALCFAAGAAALLCAMAQKGGGHAAQAVLFAAVWLVFILLPGGFFLRVLPFDETFRTACPAGGCFLLGTGFFVLLVAVAARFGTVLPLLLPLPFAAAQLWSLAKQKKRPALPAAGPVWLTAAFWALCAVVWATACAHPEAVGQNQLKQDFLWTVGNVRSFYIAFPPQDIRFVGVRLSYHYLHELLTAGIGWVSGISCYDLLAFWMPAAWTAACAFTGYELAGLLHKDRPAGRLMPWFLACSGSAGFLFALAGAPQRFESNLLYHLVTNVNACATALCYLCVLLAVVVLLFRADWKAPLLQYPLALCAFAMLLVGKGPVGILLVLALAAAVAVQFFQRRGSLRAVVFTGAVVLLTAAVYRFLFSAGTNNMAFGLSGTLLKSDAAGLLLKIERLGPVWYYLSIPFLWLADVFLMHPAVVGLYLPAAVRDLLRLGRLPGERLLLHAASVGGVLAYYLFDHYALSQVYFLFLSVWCMAAFLPEVLADRGLLKRYAAVMCCVGAAGGAFSAARIAASGAGLLLPGGYTAAADEIGMTAGDEAAMAWLCENTGEEILFATNRYHTGSPMAGNSNLYTAFSGRQAYMEGFRYTISNMGVSQQVVDERFVNNAILFSPKSDAETILQLARAEGITHLVFSTQLGERPAAFDALLCCYENPDVQIYDLRG